MTEPAGYLVWNLTTLPRLKSADCACVVGFFAAALVAPAKLAYDGKLLLTLRNASKILFNLFAPAARHKPVEESSLSWFRLGPAILFWVVFTAYLHW